MSWEREESQRSGKGGESMKNERNAAEHGSEEDGNLGNGCMRERTASGDGGGGNWSEVTVGEPQKVECREYHLFSLAFQVPHYKRLRL